MLRWHLSLGAVGTWVHQTVGKSIITLLYVLCVTMPHSHTTSYRFNERLVKWLSGAKTMSVSKL
jgi:hypothetical protein